MYAFLSHTSACDALRTLGNTVFTLPRWPAEPRELPRHYNTVTTQGMFKQFAQTIDLTTHGITRTPVDLLVPKASQRSRGRAAAFHLWKQPVPACAMLRLEESLFVSSPEFALLQLVGWHTRTQPIIETFTNEIKVEREARALAGIEGPLPYDNPLTWDNAARILEVVLMAMEFMGTYRRSASEGSTTYHQPSILSDDSMRRFLASVPNAYGKNRVDSVLELSLAHSASPMETALALMLSLPEAYGGYALPKPQLNPQLPVKNHELLWSGGPAITPDLFWPEAKLAIEYDSDEMHGSAGPRKLADDATRANVLASIGCHVLRMTTLNIQSLADVERLAQQVGQHLGIVIPEASDALKIRRSKLHGLLMRQ